MSTSGKLQQLVATRATTIVLTLYTPTAATSPTTSAPSTIIITTTTHRAQDGLVSRLATFQIGQGIRNPHDIVIRVERECVLEGSRDGRGSNIGPQSENQPVIRERGAVREGHLAACCSILRLHLHYRSANKLDTSRAHELGKGRGHLLWLCCLVDQLVEQRLEHKAVVLVDQSNLGAPANEIEGDSEQLCEDACLECCELCEKG